MRQSDPSKELGIDLDTTVVRVQVPVSQTTAGRTMEGAAETVAVDITLRDLRDLLLGSERPE